MTQKQPTHTFSLQGMAQALRFAPLLHLLMVRYRSNGRGF